MFTEEDFKRITGYDPVNDDLERMNCKDAGILGHSGCGVCSHGKPKFMCFENHGVIE